MADRFDLSYEATREDLLKAFDVVTRESAGWKDAKRLHLRAVRRQTLVIAPFIIVGCTVFIGRAAGTQGMYLEGAALGAVFSAFLFFALPRLNTFDKATDREIERVKRMDVSAYLGKMTISVDEVGVTVHSPQRTLNLSWQVTKPMMAGGYVIFLHAGNDATVIPQNAFASPEAAIGFIDQANRWWEAGQLPHAERLQRYLADRDCLCLRCKYNLRGSKCESCSECGEPINLDSLTGLP